MLENHWLKVGMARVPITDYRVIDGRVYLKYSYNATVKDELKASASGPKFHRDLGNRWSFKDNQRTRFVLNLLSGGDWIKRWDKPLETFEPRRDCLYAHQLHMAAQALHRRRCILAAEMGTGKTLSAIECMEQSGYDDWWYVAPKSALVSVALELTKWDAQVIPLLMTYEKFRRAIETWRPGTPPPRGVVFDESSRLKSHKAKRTKAAMHLSESMAREHGGEEFVILMTGTPAPKNPLDWWAQCEVAQPGFLREGSTYKMQERYAWTEKVDYGHGNVTKVTEWKEDEIAKLPRRLDGLVMVKLKKDCLDLPDKVYETFDLKPSDEMARAAGLIARSSESAIQALTALRQLSDGFQYVTRENESRETKWLGSPKLDKLQEIIEQHEEVGRIVIYAGFHGSVDAIVDRLPSWGWNYVKYDGRGLRTDVDNVGSLADGVSYFQDAGSESPCAFVAHPASGGMGLTLTASPTIVYYSNDFDAESRQQSEDRIHRAGMDVNRGARIIDLHHLATDKLVSENLKRKRSLQSLSVGEVKHALR